jgi:hypothetical protein
MKKLIIITLFILGIKSVQSQTVNFTVQSIMQGIPCTRYEYLDSTFFVLLDSTQKSKLNYLLKEIEADISKSELISFRESLQYRLGEQLKEMCYSYIVFDNFENSPKTNITISYNGFGKRFAKPKLCIGLVKQNDSDAYELFVYQFRST